MTAKIINMALRAEDAKRWDGPTVLRAAMQHIEEGVLPKNTRILVVAVDPDTMDTIYYQNGLQCSELITAVEIIKSQMLQELGF